MSLESVKKNDLASAPLLAEQTQDGITRREPVKRAPAQSLIKALPQWWRVARLWFFGEDKWRARGFAVAALLLSLIRIWMLVRVSFNQRNFETALAEKDKAGFHKALWGFAGLISVAAPLFAATDFVENRLKVEWRAWLTTQLLARYYANRSFYRLHQCDASVDNPDQRICDDVPNFTEGSTDLLIGITRKLFGVVAFSGVLWMVAPSLVFFLFAYTALGTWLTTSVFGRRLMQLSYTVLMKEGDLRFNLVRTRENSESIAFYFGEAREAEAANSRLGLLVGYTKRKIAWMGGLSLWTNFYSYVTMLIPPILTAPRYFAGEVEFGAITQVSFAFRHIEGALNYFVDNLDKFSGLAAQSERLDALLTVFDDRSEEALRIMHTRQLGPGLCLEGLTVRTPTGGQIICKGLDLLLKPAQSLLIVGSSGCGKSSLLRAISGLWTSGSGTIHSPGAEEMFFLPQKPYMPSGTLRQQLLYPSGFESSALERQRSIPLASDPDLMELLDRMALPGLAERVGGLETEVEWSHMLSLGEQQRVAFARLLLHRPGLAFLDEATGAVDSETEALLYRALQNQLSSYISIGHRKELCAFHTHVLEHRGGWQWKSFTMQEYLRQRK